MKHFFEKNRIKFVAQHDYMDCGPACLTMVSRYYGKKYSIQKIRELTFLARDGVSLLGIQEGAKRIGFETLGVKISLNELVEKATTPCVLFWNQKHYVVLFDIKRNPITKKHSFKIADPSHGILSFNQNDFEKGWLYDGVGIALFLNPTEDFYSKQPPEDKKFILKTLLKFVKPYKRELLILGLGLLASSVFTLIFPFLTKALIDEGVSSKNLHIVTIILLSQIFLFLGSVFIEVIRNWVLLFINSKINITIVSDFLNKIVKLPIKFFDSKQTGDFSQRIQDHERIENFLTSQSLLVVFSSLNLLVFFLVLTYFDVKILIVYSALTVLAIIWSLFFLKKLEKIDYYKFQQKSENQQSVFELINGIREIKLNGLENRKLGEWGKIQIKLFKVNLRALKLDQIQVSGYDFINQFKNIIVIFIASREVILGNITLGSLLSISYIIGQMNSPINQLIDFFKSWQFAKLSLERLNEVQEIENEEKPTDKILLNASKNGSINGIGININNLYFQYHGPRSPFVLDDINIFIPHGKTTAIVGESGSGKTTLMKLLLKFYNPVKGDIYYGDYNLRQISAKNLRTNCGAVLQDGYIFSDTIERNIATGDEEINQTRLKKAMEIANVKPFVDNMPLKLKTRVGASGNGLSGGQIQRILIARAVYKNPNFIFFDEATSSLDAENEKIIYENLHEFFEGKTVVKIAHRLSTVKNADQIIVLKHGKVVESGTHSTLIAKKASYYNLVKNQLELSA